jgi:hypothetical protein
LRSCPDSTPMPLIGRPPFSDRMTSGEPTTAQHLPERSTFLAVSIGMAEAISRCGCQAKRNAGFRSYCADTRQSGGREIHAGASAGDDAAGYDPGRSHRDHPHPPRCGLDRPAHRRCHQPAVSRPASHHLRCRLDRWGPDPHARGSIAPNNIVLPLDPKELDARAANHDHVICRSVIREGPRSLTWGLLAYGLPTCGADHERTAAGSMPHGHGDHIIACSAFPE